MINPLIPYGGFTTYTPTLPEFYWDVYSSEQRIKHICYELCKLAQYDDYLAEQLGLTREDVEQLIADFERFKESGFDDYYKQQVHEWIAQNFKMIMNGLLGHMLFFGLTNDGYFTAYIPPKWAFILDTDIVYESPNYGCLEIIY